MKIVVMNCAKMSIEVLDVEDGLIEDDVERFLKERGYPTEIISWFAAPIDSVPLEYHNFEANCDGNEVHTVRNASLKDISTYDSAQELKKREQEELKEKLIQCGSKVDGGYEWHFDKNSPEECPVVAAYDYDKPCEVVIVSVMLDKDGYLTIMGDVEEDRGNEHEIYVDDIFAGQMTFITSLIGE